MGGNKVEDIRKQLAGSTFGGQGMFGLCLSIIPTVTLEDLSSNQAENCHWNVTGFLSVQFLKTQSLIISASPRQL